MSEFSESYHLEADDSRDAVGLLERTGQSGFVFPPGNGWVTLVPSWKKFGEPNEALVHASEGVLLHYLNDEDAGWMFEMFSDRIGVSRYECHWLDWSTPEDTLRIETSELDMDAVAPVAIRHGADPQRVMEELHRLLFPRDPEWLWRFVMDNDLRNPGHAFASLMGLEHFAWVSASSVSRTGRNEPGLLRVEGRSSHGRGAAVRQVLRRLRGR